MKNFFKGIVVGLGGVAPGLSGSVLMVIFGLYQKTIECISSIFDFKRLKENLTFLIPLGLGMIGGVILFSKTVNFLLSEFEVYTRFAFLGLILGTLPLLNKEVRKEGFKPIYYVVIAVCFVFGLWILYSNSFFSEVKDPNLLHSFVLGISVAGSYIVPGVDSAAILNALGMYQIWLDITSVKILDLQILIPAFCGLAVGVLGISFIINKLIKHFYTATFSVIFGLFLSVIPSVIVEMKTKFTVGLNSYTIGGIIAVIVGFFVSLYLGDIAENNKKIKKLFARKESAK